MDKRKNNGNKGHSTVAKGVDKRKNSYRDALDVISIDALKEVLTMLHKKATKDDDTVAGKILLEWYLSKPTVITENNNSHTINDFDIKTLYDNKAEE